MGLCITRDMPPPYNEQSNINIIKHMCSVQFARANCIHGKQRWLR